MNRNLNQGVGEGGGKCEEEPLGMPGNGTKRRSTSNGPEGMGGYLGWPEPGKQ